MNQAAAKSDCSQKTHFREDETFMKFEHTADPLINSPCSSSPTILQLCHNQEATTGTQTDLGPTTSDQASL